LQIVIPATMMVLSGCSNSAGSPVRRKPGGGNWFARLATQRVGCCWKVGGSKSLFGQIEIPAFQKRQHPTFSFSSANRKLVPHKSYHRFLQICKFSVFGSNRKFMHTRTFDGSFGICRLAPFRPKLSHANPNDLLHPRKNGTNGTVDPVTYSTTIILPHMLCFY
jgi:hypothetical protein